MFEPGDVVRVTVLMLNDFDRGLRVGDVGAVTESSHDLCVFFWRIKEEIGCVRLQLEKVDD